MKRLMMILLCTAFAGIVLMGTGFAFGANTQLYIDGSGLHMGDSNESEKISKTAIQPITEIEVDVASAEIQIIPSADYGFEINSRKNPQITYTNENGKLKISQSGNYFWKIFGFDFNFSHDSIKIFLPEDAKLQTVYLKTMSGKVSIGKLQCQTLNVRAVSGSVSAEKLVSDTTDVNCTSGNVTINESKSEKFNLNLTSGSLKASGIQSNGLTADLTSGSATIEGELLGANTFKLISGSLRLNISGAKQDYRRFVNVISGSIYIDGEKNNTGDSNSSAKNSLNINLTSGSARIDFSA